MRIQRRAVVTVASLALSMAAAMPGIAQQRQQPAQRGGPPQTNTPYILVTAFSTDNRKLALEAADELRKRIQDEHSARELYAVHKSQIEATLIASGYPVDSALGSADLMTLSRSMHGEYAISGKASRTGTGNGVRLETKILLSIGTTTLVQPLPPADGKDLGEAAKIIERALAEALKGIPYYRECIAALRAQDFALAEKNARLGLQAYQNSVLSRICLLQAQTSLKAPADSIIANAKAILAVDSTSLLALANLVDAYKAKGDTASAIGSDLGIAHLDSLNPTIVLPLVDDLYRLSALDKALGLLEPLLKENPFNGALLKKRWALLMTSAAKGAPGGYKQAIAAGQAMVKVDTAEATVDYFKRQIGGAQTDSNATAVTELATQGSEKFPKEITFHLLVAQAFLKQGKFQQALDPARRALEIDPKNIASAQYVLFALNQLGQADSVLGAAQKMIAGGIPQDSVAASLSASVAPVMKRAQTSNARADWEAGLKAAEAVDAVVPSAETSFYVAWSSFQVAADILPHVQTLSASTKAADKAQACTEVKQAEDLLVKTSIAMQRGASFNKAAAAQILTSAGSSSDYITQVKRTVCK